MADSTTELSFDSHLHAPLIFLGLLRRNKGLKRRITMLSTKKHFHKVSYIMLWVFYQKGHSRTTCLDDNIATPLRARCS